MCKNIKENAVITWGDASRTFAWGIGNLKIRWE
jgi:hypothetical protein